MADAAAAVILMVTWVVSGEVGYHHYQTRFPSAQECEAAKTEVRKDAWLEEHRPTSKLVMLHAQCVAPDLLKQMKD
jgi:hypothetical protein